VKRGIPARFQFPTKEGAVSVEVDIAHVAAHLADLDIGATDLRALLSQAELHLHEGATCISATLGRTVGRSRLLPTPPGSEVFWGYRPGRTTPTRFVVGDSLPTRTLTAWVRREGPSRLRLLTVYAGPPAPLEVHDPALTAADRPAAEAFWQEHALAAERPGRTLLCDGFDLATLPQVGGTTALTRSVPPEHTQSLSEGARVVIAGERLNLAPGDRMLARSADRWFWVECPPLQASAQPSHS
jgi:hypothetical protein